MGSWKLEVFRMGVYIAFPVLMFHLFNNPEYFEESVVKTKREMHPPVDPAQAAAFEELKAHFRKNREMKIEQEYLASNKG